MPSPETQRRIAKEIDAQAAGVRTMEDQLDGFAELLAEYRDALISEVIAGSLDVPSGPEHRAEASTVSLINLPERGVVAAR